LNQGSDGPDFKLSIYFQNESKSAYFVNYTI